MVADVVSHLAADILAPTLCHFNACGLVVLSLHHGVDVTGVEVVARAHGADGLHRLHRKGLAAFGGVDPYGTRPVGQSQRAAQPAHAHV